MTMIEPVPFSLDDLHLPVMAAPTSMGSSLELVTDGRWAGTIGGLQAATAGSPEDLAHWMD